MPDPGDKKWITAEVGRPRTDETEGTVQVQVGVHEQPGQVVWEGNWLHASQFGDVLWRTIRSITGPVARSGPPGVLGEIRRDPQESTVAVCTGRLWKVVGPDPFPWMYGWRDGNDVADWVISGNALSLAAVGGDHA